MGPNIDPARLAGRFQHVGPYESICDPAFHVSPRVSSFQETTVDVDVDVAVEVEIEIEFQSKFEFDLKFKGPVRIPEPERYPCYIPVRQSVYTRNSFPG